jgi:DNA polymerase
MVYLDFETRSECDIKKCGAYVYSQHPTTSVLCMAWAVEDEPVQLWVPGQPFPDEMVVLPGYELEAHNVFFERCIWENIMVPRYNWPRIAPEQWRCSAARVAARALPRSLGGAAAALKLAFQKDMEGSRIMLKLARPRKPTKDDKSKWNEDPIDMGKLYAYCKQDVETERAIAKTVRPLSAKELEVWQLDQKINARGIFCDQKGCTRAIRIMDRYNTKLLKELVEITDKKVTTGSQRDRIIAWAKEEGTELDGLTKQEVVEALGGNELSPEVRRVLELRQSLSKTSIKKYQAMLNSSSKDGRIRDTLMYHGASTGRWTGRLVQMQNLPRGLFPVDENTFTLLQHENSDVLDMIYGDVAGVISSCIRGMLCAAPGQELIVADYSAIEARCVLWLAGEERGLRAFREGQDLYVEMARKIYRKEDISKKERAIGKAAVLGCGYGMSHMKFQLTVKNNAGIEVSEALAKAAVQTYRTQFSLVPKFWYAQEAAAISAVQHPGQLLRCGKAAWAFHTDNVLYCRLPSGRCLAYNEPQVNLVEKFGREKLELSYMVSVQGQWTREATFGGKIAEQISQATARDLMAAAMLRVEKAGFPVVLTVHDEIVTEVPEGTKTVKELEDLMCVLPPWAAGLPIAAEGWAGRRYRK